MSLERKQAGWTVHGDWGLNRCQEGRGGGFELWQDRGVC